MASPPGRGGYLGACVHSLMRVASLRCLGPPSACHGMLPTAKGLDGPPWPALVARHPREYGSVAQYLGACVVPGFHLDAGREVGTLAEKIALVYSSFVWFLSQMPVYWALVTRHS